jgi:hypothetical protein
MPTSRDTASRQLSDQLKEFARQFMGAPTDRALEPTEIVDLAARAVPHTIGAGLTLIRRDGRPTTLAASSELPERVDAIEFETGEGPCLDAVGDDDITTVDDLAHDDRWPRFSERAVRETPIRSMFGVRMLLGGEDRGALNFYAPEPRAFTDLDLGIGAVFSALSSLALQHAIERRKNVNLEIALSSSRQVGMAMGILMSSRLLTVDQAFDELRFASQHLHRKLRDVALDVTDTGVLPERPVRLPRQPETTLTLGNRHAPNRVVLIEVVSFDPSKEARCPRACRAGTTSW